MALDIHSHILPGVDDGSRSLTETEEMLSAAKAAGINAIIATPHVYSLAKGQAEIAQAFQTSAEACTQMGVRLIQGYECNYRTLLEGDAEQLLPYCIQGTQVLLLEPPNKFLPESWEERILGLQRAGMDVVIAHPERCAAFQEDMGCAVRMLEIGCEMQVSAADLYAGLLSKMRKCAVALLKAGMIGYIASDAHCTEDYRLYEKAICQYGRYVRHGRLLEGI